MMKILHIFFAAVIFSVAFACSSDRVKSPDKVFEMYEEHEAAKYYSLPPAIANKMLPEEKKTHEVKKVLKEIDHLKVLMLDGSEAGALAFGEVDQQLRSYMEQSNMKEMIRIIRNGEQISIHMREEEGQLKEVLINIHGQNGFKGITIKGALTFENIIEFVKKSDFNELESLLNP